MPKNLSLPSLRIGPAFCSIFCSGVISGSGSTSFLLLVGEVTPGLVVPYVVCRCVSDAVPTKLLVGGHQSQERAQSINDITRKNRGDTNGRPSLDSIEQSRHSVNSFCARISSILLQPTLPRNVATLYKCRPSLNCEHAHASCMCLELSR
jgi:hypothetical protein